MARPLQRLRRLAGVEPGEGRIVGWSAATLFLVEWSSIAVSNASDTLFLKRVGVEYVPAVFLLNSVLLTGTTLLAGRYAAREHTGNLLSRTFGVLAAVLAALWALVCVDAPGIATGLLILSKQIDTIALLMFWTVIGSVLTSRQGKRLVALMTAGGTIGTIAGSFTSGIFGRLLGIPTLLLVAASIFVAAAAAAVPLTRSAPPRLHRRSATTMATVPQPENLRTFWPESSLFRILVGTSFLAGILGPMLYYEFSCAADLATRTADGEQSLLALYGQLRGWINVGVLAVQVAGSAALFEWIGVPLAATLAPAAYFAGFAALGARFGLATAMPAAMGTSVLDHTIYEPAVRILAALLPQRIRTASTSAIQGPAKRAGAALGSVLILVIVHFSADPGRVAQVALPVAAIWMGLSLLLWRGYPNLLLEAASVRHREMGSADIPAVILDATTLATLRANLAGSDADLCALACSLFADAPIAVAAEALAQALVVAPAQSRDVLMTTLDGVLGASARASGGEWVPVSVTANLLRLLSTRDGLCAQQTAQLLHLVGRAEAGMAGRVEVATVLDSAAESPDPGVRLAAKLAAMRVAGEDSAEFDEAVAAALSCGEALSRAVAIAELVSTLLAGGRVRGLPAGLDAHDGEGLASQDDIDRAWTRRLHVLASHVTLPAGGSGAPAGCGVAGGCVEAAAAMAALAAVHPRAVAPLAKVMMTHVDDPDPRVRAAVLRFLGHTGLVAFAGLLVSRLSSRTDEESRSARAALEALGLAAVDALVLALRYGGRRARWAASEMLRELHADPAAMAATVDREIHLAREQRMALGVLDPAPLSRLLVQRLRESVDESIHSVLELVAAMLGDDRIAGVSRSLGRTWNVRDRAVQLEALEALLPTAERARILPLLEECSPERLGTMAAKALGRPLPSLEEALALVVGSRDLLTTALVAATVDKGLLRIAAPDFDVAAALSKLSRPATSRASSKVSADVCADASTDASKKENPMLSPVEIMLHLQTLDLFEGLTTRQLSELAQVVREVVFPTGAAIVTEGEYDDSMYFIVTGAVRILKGLAPVAELAPRGFFGEMALFDGERRSATARAVTQVRLLRLSRGDLFEVMEDQPAIGIGICQTLVRRVRGLLEEKQAPARPGG